MPDLSKMLTEQAVQGEKIERIETTCKDIKECLLGNGKPGLVLRTDRLEQKDKWKTRLSWVVLTAVIVLIVKIIGIDLIMGLAKAANN